MDKKTRRVKRIQSKRRKNKRNIYKNKKKLSGGSNDDLNGHANARFNYDKSWNRNPKKKIWDPSTRTPYNYLNIEHGDRITINSLKTTELFGEPYYFGWNRTKPRTSPLGVFPAKIYVPDKKEL